MVLVVELVEVVLLWSWCCCGAGRVVMVVELVGVVQVVELVGAVLVVELVGAVLVVEQIQVFEVNRY